MMNNTSDRDGPWLRACTLILADRHWFRRFMIAMVVVLCFALLAGWLWNAAIIGPICLIMLRHLRWAHGQRRSRGRTADTTDQAGD